jgi:toxin-antitoxin system PIN domain toxin
VSFVIDANLLLYAVNEDSEYHRKAKAFIEKCAAGAEHWCMPWPVVNAFVRISTHPAILPHPLSPVQAITIIDQVLELPQVVPAGEDSADFWKLFRSDITSLHLRGNVVSDALIVAIMRSNGVSTIYSKDKDFLRFVGIKVIDPLR